VVAQVANEEVGLHLQRTSPTMAEIFVRGPDGREGQRLVDGQRYSTAAARGGVSTFFDLIDPVGRERRRGAARALSAQYGSDSIGGSVQFVTKTPHAVRRGHRALRSYSLSAGSADASFGSHLTTAYSQAAFALQGTLTGRRASTVRAGEGTDSHNAVRRYFGLDPEFVLDDGRLPDTAFTQYGGLLKAQWALSPRSRVIASYTRSQQDGGKRYDQLLGGDGNLIADLRNLMLDRGSVRYEQSGFGPFDSLTLGYSLNSQREERVNQGGTGNPRAAVNHEYERTTVHGVQATLGKSFSRHALQLGGRYVPRARDRAVLRVQPRDQHDGRASRARARRRPARQPGRLRAGRVRGGAGPPPAGGQPPVQRVRLPGARGRQPAREQPAAVAGRRRGVLERHVPRRRRPDGVGRAEPHREPGPGVPRPAHHRPGHAGPHRLRVRGLGGRG
jgi:outer membrane receptor for ferrienterochelin and colicin